MDREAVRPPAGLLPRDRQRYVHHRNVGGAGERPEAAASIHQGGPGERHQARWRLPLSARSDNQGCRALRGAQALRAGRPHSRRHRRDRMLRRFHLHKPAAVRGLRILQERGGQGLRDVRHHRSRRQTAQQHQRRPPVRGLHARHEHGHRERPAAPGHGRRLLPGLAER